MRLPSDKDYNTDWEGNPNREGLTLGQIIEGLQKAKEKYGENCLVFISYDSTAGYDKIKSIYSEIGFNDDDLAIILSCARADDKYIVNDKPEEVFANNENGKLSYFEEKRRKNEEN